MESGEFNDSLRELTGWTRDVRTLVKGLKSVGTTTTEGTEQKPKSEGHTAFYDACVGALERMARGAHSKRLLFFTNVHTVNEGRQRKIKSNSRLLGDVFAHGVERH
ncbi:MAG: hypothetical protein ACR2G4_00335 [Pyrinomonadaceae bacterium]